MDEQQLKLIMTSFVASQFSYCPLAWMFHNRRSNNKINNIQERALHTKITIQRFSEELLTRNNSVSVHQKNLQLLLIEIFKTINGLNPPIMKEVFVSRHIPYNLRTGNELELPNAKTGIISLPREIKESQSLETFKTKIKTIKLQCSCRLCKLFVPNLGFI